MTAIEAVTADITTLKVDIIVNAATATIRNSMLGSARNYEDAAT